MIKYTRTRSGRSYDLTAPMSVGGRQQRRRAGMSEHQLHAERRENTTDRRVARARHTYGERVDEQRENTVSMRPAQARLQSELRATLRREDT